jgi:hypothetical protein
MNKEFVNYDIALGLKEIKFDEPCLGFYTYKGEIRRYTNFDGELNDFQSIKNSGITMGDNWCTAPTFSQAFRWFREKYGLDGGAFYNYTGYMWNIIDVKNSNVTKNVTIQEDDMEHYSSYEEAELACLIKLIEIVKNK